MLIIAPQNTRSISSFRLETLVVYTECVDLLLDNGLLKFQGISSKDIIVLTDSHYVNKGCVYHVTFEFDTLLCEGYVALR